MEASKVTLSEAERRLIADANIILTKNSCIEKIGHLFGNLSAIYRQKCLHLKPMYPSVFDVHPKISKGEKHNGLPWLMLDYPRSFDKTSGHLAIRTFFWWGNHYSLHLQVSGDYMPLFSRALTSLEPNHTWYTGFTADPWDMELPNGDWLAAESEPDFSNNAALVFKMAKKIPIDEWENLECMFSELYQQLIDVVTIALGTKTVK